MILLDGQRHKNQQKTYQRPIFIINKVLKHVMSLAAKSEIGAVFINAKEGAVLHTALEECAVPVPRYILQQVCPFPAPNR
jgi:hypothetical protein